MRDKTWERLVKLEKAFDKLASLYSPYIQDEIKRILEDDPEDYEGEV